MSCLQAWLKFQSTTSAAAIMTSLMGVGMMYNLYIHRTWGRHLLQDEDEQVRECGRSTCWRFV